jgi:hypothetical protein
VAIRFGLESEDIFFNLRGYLRTRSEKTIWNRRLNACGMPVGSVLDVTVQIFRAPG